SVRVNPRFLLLQSWLFRWDPRLCNCFASALYCAVSAKGASSPRKGPCPPYTISRRLRTFFQPDWCGHQAFNERRFVCLTLFPYHLVPTSSNTRSSQKISNRLASRATPAQSATGRLAGRKRLHGYRAWTSRQKSKDRSMATRERLSDAGASL